MRIVIYGVGKVGMSLAETLSEEKHDIIIIDSDKKKIEEIQKSLDVLCIAGSIGDGEVIKKANVKQADILIAVSDSDEENIIACLIGKRQEIGKTIAKIINPSYLNKEILNTYELGIDHVIHPEKEVAKEIIRLIRSPWASEVEPFLNEKILLIEVKVNEDNIEYLNEKLRVLCKNNLIIIVESGEREKKIRYFEEQKKIKLGDIVFVLEKKSDLASVNKTFQDVYTKIRNIIIMGGGITGEELLERLENTKLKVKLIERDKERCKELSEKAKKSLILCGDATDLHLLESENISKTDCFIAVTGDDENNIMASLLAKQKGVKKLITKVSKAYEEDIVSMVGLDTTVNINKVTSNNILKFVRRKELIAVSVLDENVEIMEFSARPKSKIVKKTLEDAQFIKGAIIGAVYHDDQIFFPKKNFKIEEDDLVLIFVLKKVIPVVEKYFQSKK